ncbi:MAG: hypothetical protein AB7L13_10840 [Acidimicrobiia bacterium]
MSATPDVTPDAAITDALRNLAAPGATPAFWSRLRDELANQAADEPTAAVTTARAAGAPGAEVPATTTAASATPAASSTAALSAPASAPKVGPPKSRRVVAGRLPVGGPKPKSHRAHAAPTATPRQKAVVASISGGVVVLGAVVASLIATSDGNDASVPLVVTTVSAARPTVATPARTATATATTVPSPSAPTPTIATASPVGVATQFLGALASGDLPKLKSLSGPRSQEYLAAPGAFEAAAKAAQDSLAAWTKSTDARYRLVTIDDTSAVVVVSGNRPNGNQTETRADALPMRQAGANGPWAVEWFAVDPATPGKVEVSTPAGATSKAVNVKKGATISVSTPVDGVALFSLDGASPIAATINKTATSRTASFTLPNSLTGTAVLMATVASERTFAATATVLNIG